MTPVAIGPELGDETAELIRWYVSDGEMVAEGSPVAEMSSSKAMFDLAAPASGRLQHGKEVGVFVAVGDPIGWIHPG